MDNNPLVSIGIPVRNGAETLALAIASVLKQTYKNFEIIISDNDSSDQTATLCQKIAAEDHRVHYYRQPEAISALQNFRFVHERAKGEYFMWAAHDDLRSGNYIETLLKGFDNCPSASVVFSELVLFNDYKSYKDCPSVERSYHTQADFETTGLSFIQKHRKQARSTCCQIYGLINSKYLRDFPWFDIDYAPDFPLLHWLLCHGDFIYIPGAIFYYFQPESGKDYEQMALDNSLNKLKKFPIARFAWACANSVKIAELKKDKYHNIFRLFAFFYFPRYGGVKNWIKTIIYKYTPNLLRVLWKGLKKNQNLIPFNRKLF